jgi:hypothetical protein
MSEITGNNAQMLNDIDASVDWMNMYEKRTTALQSAITTIIVIIVRSIWSLRFL